ncbi:hypothetical protein CCP3SC1AL1_1820002 [Gammaproteobacteria bacterium]
MKQGQSRHNKKRDDRKMKKIISFRTKIEAIAIAGLFIMITIGSVFAVTRTITSTGDSFDTFIRNSKGNYWTATRANLQTAIYDLANVSGTVWIPSGTIVFTNMINLTSNITIRGTGMNSTVLRLSNSYSGYQGFWLRGHLVHNVTLCDFSMDGNNRTGTIVNNAVAIQIDNSSYFHFYNIHIYNLYRAGIILNENHNAYSDLTNLFINDVDDYPTTQQMLKIRNSQYITGENFHFKGNGINRSTFLTWGMDLNGVNWSRFSDVEISGTGGGMKFESSATNICHNLTFDGITIRNLTNNGLVAGYQMQGIWCRYIKDSNFFNLNIEYGWGGIYTASTSYRLNFNNIIMHKNPKACAINGYSFALCSDFTNINNMQCYNGTAVALSHSGLYINGGDDCKITNVELKGFKKGIYISSSVRDTFVNVASENNNEYGVTLETASNMTFIGCRFKSNTIDGVDDFGSAVKNIIFSGCTVNANVKGFDLSATCTNISIDNCHIKYNTNDGIEIDSANFVNIIGNQIWGNGGEQIDDNIGATATNIKIMGNVGDATCNAFCLPTAAPTVPHSGSMYVNVTTGDIAVYSGTAWIWTHG